MVHFEDGNLVLIDEVKIPAGSWLDITILSWRIMIPPFDVVLVPKVAIPLEWLFNAIISFLDSLTDEFYKKQKEKE